MPFTTKPSPEPLTPEQQKAGQIRIISFSLVVMVITTVFKPQILSLLALKLDPEAANSTLSIFFFMPFMSIFTVLMGPLVDRVGKKKVMVPFYIASAFFPPLMVLACSLTGWFTTQEIIWILIILVMLRQLMQVLGLASWFPLMSDNLPSEIRGRFLGIMRTCWHLEVFVIGIGIKWFFGDNPEIWQFQTLFAVSFIFSIIRVFILLSISEAPLAGQTEKKALLAGILIPLRNRPFRNFLIFAGLFNFANMFQGVFALRLMKDELGTGDGTIVFLSSFVSLGAVSSLYLFGKLVDRFGSKFVYALLLPPMLCLNLVWILIAPTSSWWQWILAGYYFFFGACLFGCGVAQTTMIFASASK
ncbi:MAG: MFS transporter, partial [Planctomycetes bacterium]|nr:MFS transporter [Planctomycetota bacterium]